MRERFLGLVWKHPLIVLDINLEQNSVSERVPARRESGFPALGMN